MQTAVDRNYITWHKSFSVLIFLDIQAQSQRTGVKTWDLRVLEVATPGEGDVGAESEVEGGVELEAEVTELMQKVLQVSYWDKK